MNTELQGRVILVTGGSGGIGSAIIRAFAAEGARVVIHYHHGLKRAHALRRQLQDPHSLVIRSELASEAEVRRLFSQVLKRYGRVDTLVANAAAWETNDVPMHEMSLGQWRRTVRGVLDSTFLTVREFMRVVARQRQGNAVLIGSTAAVFGEAGHADYASAKAAIAYGLTRTLKNEFPRIAPHTSQYCGGRINCVCPGWTVVPRLMAKLENPSTVRKTAATMALPQLGLPADIANAVVFLASDKLSRHITGQTLVIAGGMEGRWLWQPEEVNPANAQAG